MANTRMILPIIFERDTDNDTEDDGALFRAWVYKGKVRFDVAFYTNDRNIIYFNFRSPETYEVDNDQLHDKISNFEKKYTEVPRDKLFKSYSAKEELEELCEELYQYLTNKE